MIGQLIGQLFGLRGLDASSRWLNKPSNSHTSITRLGSYRPIYEQFIGGLLMKAKHRWRLTGADSLVRTLTIHEYQRFKDTGLLPDVGPISGIATHTTATLSIWND
jgi:hypothetical protein